MTNLLIISAKYKSSSQYGISHKDIVLHFLLDEKRKMLLPMRPV